jgi:hypothetical protein
MADLKVMRAGKEFTRPGGRDGDWWPDPQDDDTVVSPFDFIEVPGAEAVAALATLRSTLKDRTPVLFGSPHAFGLTIERMADEGVAPADVIAALSQFDLDAWFTERVGEVQIWQEDLGKVVPPRGPWPRTSQPAMHLMTPREDVFEEFHETLLIGLVPTAHAFETPAFVGFGGWDDSPETVVHLALAREWEARFGATVAAITPAAIEFQVARPPTTRDDAERLALEHFHYSRAAVPGTLQEAAINLIGATAWRFSWD